MLKSTAERPCAHIKQHLQFRAELAEILRVARFRVSLAALLSFVAASASAQPFPSTLGREGPPAVTDVGWKWDRLDKDTYFYFVGHEGAPLILSVPDAPGDPAPAFNEYLQRYLVDEGYALGVLNWRGDFSRTAKPSDIVSRAFSNFALLRGRNPRRFDPTRIVLFGRDEGAFLAMLLSADTTRLQAAGVPPASICATVLLHPMNLDPTNPDSYLGRRQFLAEPGSLTDVSPLRHASSAPPVMIMTEAMDTEDQKRGEIAAATLKSAGRTVQQTTYPRFDPMNERTYFGWTTNPATMTLGDFLKAHCPAKRA